MQTHPITGTVKTKITYDSKGLVTDGADALTSDIADSLNRRYVTDAQLSSYWKHKWNKYRRQCNK